MVVCILSRNVFFLSFMDKFANKIWLGDSCEEEEKPILSGKTLYKELHVEAFK